MWKQFARKRRQALTVTATLSLATQFAVSGFADTTTWIAADGTWQTPSNWTNGVVPTSSLDALFNFNSAYNVSLTADANAQTTTVSTGTITLALNGQTLTTTNLNASAAGVFNFDGGTISVIGGAFTPKLITVIEQIESYGAIPFPSSLDISGASSGGAILQLAAGGSLTNSAASAGSPAIFVGNSGNRGTVIVDGRGSPAGSSTLLNSANGVLYIGAGRNLDGSVAGTGTLNVQNGSQAAISGTVAIGDSGGRGMISVDGASSNLSPITALFEIGHFGFFTNDSFIPSSGTLRLTNGGQSINNSSLYIGDQGGVGTVSIDGEGSKLTSNSSTLVGYVGYFNSDFSSRSSGTLLISNGGKAISNSELDIGLWGGTGDVEVSGGTLTAARRFLVGYLQWDADRVGSGTLNASNAAIVNSPVAVVGAAGGVGRVSVSGAGTVWTNSAALYVGNDGSGSSSADGLGTMTLSNNATVNAGSINVYSGGTILYNGGTLITGSLNIPGGHVILSSGGNKLLQTPKLSIDSGVVDLADNDAIIGSGTGKAVIQSYVKTARDGGKWDASGITSSKAQPDSGSTAVKPTGLGVLSGAEYRSVSTANSTFDGITFADTDTLVKYTYNGDADFSGKIDANDYGHIDSGFQNQNTAGFVVDWFSGDFDYSGKIDANDYALIDAAYQLQSGTLRAAIDYLETGLTPTGAISDSFQEVIDHNLEFGQAYANDFVFANVPEPRAVMTVILSATTLIRGRSRRKRTTMS